MLRRRILYKYGFSVSTPSNPFPAADTIKRRKTNWIDHVLRRNCLLTHFIERKLGGTRRRRKGRKLLQDDIKTEIRYWNLKEGALDRTLKRTRFVRGYGPITRQTTQ
jgi:hypothetical protein